MRNDWSAPGLVTALAACAVVAGSLASAQSLGQSWSERDRKLEQAREARRERRSNKVPA